MATIEREEWERDAFDNLAELCAKHGNVALASMNEPPVQPTSQRELAAGLRKMPVWDDEVWCPRLA